jgi:hypothetical protein
MIATFRLLRFASATLYIGEPRICGLRRHDAVEQEACKMIGLFPVENYNTSWLVRQIQINNASWIRSNLAMTERRLDALQGFVQVLERTGI